MSKDRALDREWKKVMRRERRSLAPQKESVVQQKLAPVTEKIADKVPEKAIAATEAAFAKGFAIVFEQGTGVIEKTFSKEKRQAAHFAGEYLRRDGETKASIKTMDKAARNASRANKVLTTVEGGALGVLGIGLPDIPVYVGVLLKTVYEIALSYGYTYDDSEEQIFILAVIGMAASQGTEREKYASRADRVGMLIESGQLPPLDKQALIEETARLLTTRLLTAKFVQGLPIVGVVGAAANYRFLAELSQAAEIKYKKRYLRRLQQETR